MNANGNVATKATEREWIQDLAEAQLGDGRRAIVRGIIIDLREGSGLIYRCPTCRRPLRTGLCRLHGAVGNPEPDLRVKAVVDDGSGALTALFGRDLTASFVGASFSELVDEAAEEGAEGIRDRLADELVAQPIEIEGDVTADDYGLTMSVDRAMVLRIETQPTFERPDETTPDTPAAKEGGTCPAGLNEAYHSCCETAAAQERRIRYGGH